MDQRDNTIDMPVTPLLQDNFQCNISKYVVLVTHGTFTLQVN